MLIRDDQTIVGSVSGGCVEGAVVEAALTMIDSAGGQRLDFGVADADAWEVGLSCGGEISIWLVSVADNYFAADLLHKIAALITGREPFGLQFNLVTGQVQMVSPPMRVRWMERLLSFYRCPAPNLSLSARFISVSTWPP